MAQGVSSQSRAPLGKGESLLEIFDSRSGKVRAFQMRPLNASSVIVYIPPIPHNTPSCSHRCPSTPHVPPTLALPATACIPSLSRKKRFRGYRQMAHAPNSLPRCVLHGAPSRIEVEVPELSFYPCTSGAALFLPHQPRVSSERRAEDVCALEDSDSSPRGLGQQRGRTRKGGKVEEGSGAPREGEGEGEGENAWPSSSARQCEA
ncbi:hypothetical protein FB451DRAFT_1562182 [Mycena latifolia]|nr:hypothetical protein FB451DRAFT_1562182 [Mycena latifolia]